MSTPLHFGDRLSAAVRRARTPVVVGIDPRPESLPAGMLARALAAHGPTLRAVALAIEEFACGVLDAVAALVPATKVQAAFFEAYGPEGMASLARVLQRAKQLGLLVILDAKRGDIGATTAAYAEGYLGRVRVGDELRPSWAVDALTVNPYLGIESLGPFATMAAEHGGGLFVLVRTSNPGAAEFQDYGPADQPLYRTLARRLEDWGRPWLGRSGASLVGAVAGATYPDQLRELRRLMPSLLLLVPGYGAQGAGPADVAGAFHPDGTGAIVTSSRGLTFAYARPPYSEQFPPDRWQDAVAQATRDMIAALRRETPAGALGGPD